MISLFFNEAKLQARSLTPRGLERPLQSPGTVFHFAMSKSILHCANGCHVSTRYRKDVFSRP